MLPKPMLVLLFEETAEPNPETGMKRLLLIHPLAAL
jgi:hypothetical protein